MKKLLMALLASFLSITGSQAALILSETFNYADGILTNVSGGVWTNHSGAIGQVDVASGKVNLTQTEAEDVNTGIAGAPYNGPILYSSFVVNFSALPFNGAGTYFAHFKDNGTANFRARVFASISGAAAGQFRVGVANNSGTAVMIARDLSLGQDYTLVLRYNTGTGIATLWISPSGENSITDRADGTDAPAVVGITTFALRQSNASGGMGVLTLDELKVGTAFTDVVEGGDPTLNPPSISSIPDQSIAANGVTPAVPFTVNDGETAPADLTLSAASSNTGLIPEASVVFATGEGGSNRTVTVTPTPGQQGFSRVTVTVTDGNNNTASRDFLVIVGAPSVSSFVNLETPRDTATAPISFTVGDGESDFLTLSATSTNEAVVPVSGISFAGSGINRTVTIAPASGAAGLSRITVLVSDGFNVVSNSFVVTVFQTAGLLFSDTFNYADGPLVPNSSFVWNTHSGTTEQVKVSDGKIYISGTNGEDVSAFLGVQSYPPGGGWILYASFTVDFKTRPIGSGDYFAHFRNASTSFGCKIFSTATGAAAGKFRLGIANSANAPSATWPVELDTNVAYTVVTRLNVGTGSSTLWVNPASESSPSIKGTDSAFPFEVFTYAFRESGGIGDMAIDDIKVGTAFTDVAEVRYSLAIVASGNDVQISWPTAASTAGYSLESTDTIDSANWTPYTGAISTQGDRNIVRLFGVTDNRFFRLVK